MVSTFIRAFAIMLALTGFSASTVTSTSSAVSSRAGGAHANGIGGVSQVPCPYNDPNCCGLM